jgi:hypothetical protein
MAEAESWARLKASLTFGHWGLHKCVDYVCLLGYYVRMKWTVICQGIGIAMLDTGRRRYTDIDITMMPFLKEIAEDHNQEELEMGEEIDRAQSS